MKVIFTKADRDEVAKALKAAGLVHISERRIDDVLYNVEAAFIQQFLSEVGHMINEFELGN